MLTNPRLSSVLFALCLAPSTALAAEPSFDCAVPETAAETAICADAGLAALDVELARLYGLALGDPDMGGGQRATLRSTERRWMEERDACATAAAKIESCIAAAYALRIHDIREGSAAARSADGSGVSIGPTAWRCDGLSAYLSVTFVNVEPSLVAMRWRDQELVLPITRSASGAHYASETEAHGKALFWTKGDQALFAEPGGPELACAMDKTG